MKHNSMTGTIQLSVNDSVRMRQNLLFNMTENDRKMKKYFDDLAENMIIHSDGTLTTVEFEDLDLSDLLRTLISSTILSKSKS